MKRFLKLFQVFVCLALIGLTEIPIVSAAYTANYTVSDIDDIFVDVLGTAAVEVKSDVPTYVDLGSLWLIFALLISCLGLAIGMFIIVPRKIKGLTGKTRA